MPRHPTRRPPDPIERLARPFLAKLSQVAAEQQRSPSDYFLLIGKYDEKSSIIVPRAAAAEVLDAAKTSARRRKYEGLLASPCEPDELLVMVCAGDHVEGHWMRVPTVVAPERRADPEVMPPDVEQYLRKHLGGIVQAVEKKNGRLGDWMAILRVPDEVPVVFRKSVAPAQFAKLGNIADDVLREIAKPAPDDELFCAHPTAGRLAWYRVSTSFPVQGSAVEEGRDRFAQRLVGECKASLESVGQKPDLYMAYVRWPPAAGQNPHPKVFPRVEVREHLRALEGTKKLEQILALLADPYDGMMLFIDDEGEEDIRFTFRDDGEFQREADAMLAEAIRQGRLPER